MLSAIALAAVAGTACLLREKSLRRTHPMAGGLHPDIALAHSGRFELWHNALSLCSKKVRMCLAELGVAYVSHHIDLIETGSYQTLSREFLAVNPAALVPVLVHDGHPVYESHEIIRYAAEHSPGGSAMLPIEPRDVAMMDHWIHKSSLLGDHPVSELTVSAGNCVPGLTIPLFSAMIADIPAWRIVEGLLFHRLKGRPAFFMLLKLTGLARLDGLLPVVKLIGASRAQMERHLDELEAHLANGALIREPTPRWIVGHRFTLADVSWAVIMDRLREADWTDVLESPRRPNVSDWWRRIRERPAYRASMLGEFEHPLVRKGTERIIALKAHNERFRGAIYTSR